MADTKLSALTAATALDNSDELYVNDSGTSKKITVGNFKTTVLDALSGNDLTVKLGDNAGTNKLSITDSDDAEVVSVGTGHGLTLWRDGYSGSRGFNITFDTGYVELDTDDGSDRIAIKNGGTSIVRFDGGSSTSGQHNYNTFNLAGIVWQRGYDFNLQPFDNTNDVAANDLILKGADAYASASTNQDGGNINLKMGEHASGGGDAGKVQFLAPDDSVEVSFGENGEIYLNNLPTSDPASANQLWNDSGTLKVSAG